MNHFDLFVIGAGPGGYEAALEAASLGKSVALAEEREIGGVCLNRGCIPTKALLKSAHLYADLKEAQSVGINAKSVSVKLPQMLEHAREIEGKLRDGISFLLKKGKVELFPCHATVKAPSVVLAGEEEVSADHILLATGSRPAVIPIPGHDLPGVVSSDDLLTGDGVDCQRLVIVGGGVIGAEFAEFYQSLGREVVILEAMPRLLPRLDRELGQSLAQAFKKRGIEIHTGAFLSKIEPCADGLCLTYTEKEKEATVTGDAVLLCTGRKPNTEGLIPEELGLSMERGMIETDENGMTNVSGIWAIGDIVKGSMQLAHTATAEGKRAVHAMFDAVLPESGPVPSCIFTEPEIATVGISQEEAKERGLKVFTQKSLTSANGRSLVEGTDRGFAKLIFEEETGKLIGAQLMCAHASEMIGALGALIHEGATADSLKPVIWPHPTVSEILSVH